jgi:hypothetical protein
MSKRALRKHHRDQALGLPINGAKPATARVRCSNQFHQIVFDGKALHFPGHPNLGRDKLLFKMGGRCRCLEVQRAWARMVNRLLPAGLYDAYCGWRLARRGARAAARRGTDQLDSLRERIIRRIARAVKTALSKCDYRLSPDGNHTVQINVGGEPGGAREDLLSWGVPASRLRLQVGWGWYLRVWKRGLAVVEGKLVLAVLTEDDLRYRKELQALKRPCPKPWWVEPLGEDPDLTQGPYVLALCPDPLGSVNPLPARVVEIAGPDGKLVKVLQAVQAPG